MAGSTEHGASATIYRIDRITGVPTVFVRLPQQADPNLPWNPLAGPGIGNLAYDESHDQFFATNLDNGTIYQIDNLGLTGVIVDSFDPDEAAAGLALDNGLPGMPTFGDNLWGIGVANNAVYYSVWRQGTTTDPILIRKVDLDGSGNLIKPSDQTVFTVPPTASAGGSRSTPVSDIAFSADGTKMVLGERGMFNTVGGDYYTTANHVGPVKIIEFISGSWTMTNGMDTGNSGSPSEGYGGIAYGYENGNPEELIWMGSADMITGAGPHGLQGVRPSDFPATVAPAPMSYLVPYDPGYTAAGPDVKSIGGDVEIMQDEAKCMRIEVVRIDCPDEIGAPIKVTLNIDYLVDKTAVRGWFTPCPDGELPAGSITLTPDPDDLFDLATPIGQGDSIIECIYLSGLKGGETVCLRFSLFTETMEECCTEKFCFEVPECDCAELLDATVACEDLANGDVKFTITMKVKNLTNLTSNPYSFSYATFVPLAGFLSNNATPTPDPIPPGGTGTIVACWICAVADQPCPDTLNFTLGLHSDSIEDCCSIEVSIDLPPKVGKKPDECALSPERAPCCPDPAGLGDFATVTLTICNNFCVERSYDWIAIDDPSDPSVLAFLPLGGVIGPIPPGGCESVTIRIHCDGVEVGKKARYKIRILEASGATTMCCIGSVYKPEPGTVVIKPDDPAGLVGPIDLGGATTLNYTLSNTGAEAVDVPLLLVSDYGALALSVGGGDVGGPQLLTGLSIGPGETVPFSVTARRLDDGTNLPSFVRVHVYLGGDLRTFGHLAPDLTQAVQLVPAVGPAPIGASLRTRSIERVKGPSGDLIKIEIEVLSGPIQVDVRSGSDLQTWTLESVSLTADGPAALVHSLAIGIHELFLAQPALKQRYYRVYVE